jgi:RimJ/RimL family protein N-acetyltransferase
LSTDKSTHYFLTSRRLGFRYWTPDDLPLAMGLWGDPQVTRYIDARHKLAKAQVLERLSREIATAEAHNVQYWPNFLLDGGDHVGCTGLRAYKPAERVYEFGVHLRPQYWGQGYAAEAARAVIGHAFDKLGATALFAGHHPANDASRRLLSSLGFRFTHEEFYPPTGLVHPAYLLDPDEYRKLNI